ncbi:hypothetical protein JKY72_05010 [Candidatus Gracilibacteria bacterium]|nr:hypothetical protein [Candidatus Gracilibacteria bacterium]
MGITDQRKVVEKNDFFAPITVGGGIDNKEALIKILVSEIGEKGLEELVVFLLENDNSLNNTDTFENYQDFKPYPSYLVYFAYILIFDSPKGVTPKSIYTRKLFDIFWEHQSKLKPGLYVDSAKHFIQPFIDNGAVTLEELREIAVKDWYRWQEKGYPYYGPNHGYLYFMHGFDAWLKKEEELKEEWFKRTEKKAKEEGAY